MAHLIDKSALVAEIERRYKLVDKYETNEFCAVASRDELVHLMNFIDTLEVKEVNEVPATVMVNKYGNRFISSWSGLKEYDNFNDGEEIKILIPKK